MRIALAQVDCTLGDVDANLARAERVLAEARGADLVVFPELALSGYSLGAVDDDLSLEVGDDRLVALAQGGGDAAVVLGFPESGPGLHTFNSAAYYEGGALRWVHRKLYLPTYDIFEERKHFSPGQSMRAFDTRCGRQAILVCNDAWQPQLAFLAIQDGARILFVPSSSAQSRFPQRYDSSSYWHDITRFYGRMFQTFVVFVNRVGQEGELRFWGGSHVVDPWGQVIAQAPLGEEALVVADLDLDDVRRRRREVPMVREARLALLAREFRRLMEEGGDL